MVHDLMFLCEEENTERERKRKKENEPLLNVILLYNINIHKQYGCGFLTEPRKHHVPNEGSVKERKIN